MLASGAAKGPETHVDLHMRIIRYSKGAISSERATENVLIQHSSNRSVDGLGTAGGGKRL